MLVEDDDFLRAATSEALKRYRINIVGTASTAPDAISVAKKNNPDVAILDINLGGGPTGIDIAHGLRKSNEKIGLIFLTSYSDVRFAGIRTPDFPDNVAYILKKNISDVKLLVEAIKDVDSHSKHRRNGLVAIDQRSTEELTNLQVDLMQMIHAGMSNSQIAINRGTTVKSTETAIARLAKKLDITTSSSTSQRVLIAKRYSDMNKK